MKVYIRGVNKYLKHNVNRVTKNVRKLGQKLSWASLGSVHSESQILWQHIRSSCIFPWLKSPFKKHCRVLTCVTMKLKVKTWGESLNTDMRTCMFLSVDTLQVKQSHRLSYLLFSLYRSFASHPVSSHTVAWFRAACLQWVRRKQSDKNRNLILRKPPAMPHYNIFWEVGWQVVCNHS